MTTRCVARPVCQLPVAKQLSAQDARTAFLGSGFESCRYHMQHVFAGDARLGAARDPVKRAALENANHDLSDQVSRARRM